MEGPIRRTRTEQCRLDFRCAGTDQWRIGPADRPGVGPGRTGQTVKEKLQSHTMRKSPRRGNRMLKSCADRPPDPCRRCRGPH